MLQEERKLYPHNQQAFDEAMFILENSDKVAIVQATGTGKGVLAAEFINKPYRGKKVLILAPNNSLLTNYEESLGIDSDSKYIKLLTYPSVLSETKKNRESVIEFGLKIDLLILDEFHRLGAECWGEAVGLLINSVISNGGKVLGLSATPIRYLDNKKDMGDILFGDDIVRGVTLEEAIALGILPAFRYIVSMYGFEEKIAKYRSYYDKLKANVRPEKANQIEQKLSMLETMGTSDAVLSNTIQSEIKRLEGPQKWIVFCSDTEELQTIDEHLGIWFNRDLNKFTANSHWKASDDKLNLFNVYSCQSQKEEMANLKGFYDVNQGISIITCINKLNEGLHVKGITGIIMLRRTISPIIYLQQIGRALSAGRKNIPIIFDFINNCQSLKINNICGNMQRTSTLIESYGSQSSKENIGAQKIIVKNTVKSMLSLFEDLSELVEPNLAWSLYELSKLRELYPVGGAEYVKNFVSPTRTTGAIDAKAREEGLVFDPKTMRVVVNKSPALTWSKQDVDFIYNYILDRVKNGAKPMQAATELQVKYPNRSVNAIYDKYDARRRSEVGRGAEFINSGKPWSPADKQILIELYNPNNLDCLSIMLDRSPDAIRVYAQKDGIRDKIQNYQGRDLRKWTPEEEEFIAKNPDLGLDEIAVTLDRSVSSVSSKLPRVKARKEGEKLKENFKPNKFGILDLELDYILKFYQKGPKQLALEVRLPEAKIIEAVKKFCRETGTPYFW